MTNTNKIVALACVLILVLTSSCSNNELFPGTVTIKNGYTTVSDIRPGQLKNALGVRMLTVTKLAIEDTINSRDFRTMRDEMPFLKDIDLSKATIVGYHGFDGTATTNQYYYPDNTIPEFAFYNPAKSVDNIKLNSIILPSNIRAIGNYAFNRCVNLSGTLEIPASVTDTIGKSAFGFCTGLTGIHFSPVQYIGESAFQGCSGLSGQLVIPENCVTIDNWAFADCPSVTGISLPASLTYIGYYVFENSVLLKNIAVNSNNSSYALKDGFLIDSNLMMIKFCSPTVSGNVVLSSDFMFIDNAAFSNCKKITSITIPASIFYIGNRAFYNCSGLTSIYAQSDSPVDMSSTADAFDTLNLNAVVLHVPPGATAAYRADAVWSRFTHIVEN